MTSQRRLATFHLQNTLRISYFFKVASYNEIKPFVIFDGTDLDLKKRKTYDERRLRPAEVASCEAVHVVCPRHTLHQSARPGSAIT